MAVGQLMYAPPVAMDAGAAAFSLPMYMNYQFPSSPPAFSMPAYTEALGTFYGSAAPAAGFGQPQVVGAELLEPAAVDEQTARYQTELEADLEQQLNKLEQDTAASKEALSNTAEQSKADGKRRIAENMRLQKDGLGLLEQQRLDSLRAAAKEQNQRMEVQARELTRQWHEQKAQEAFRHEQGSIHAKQRAAQADMSAAHSAHRAAPNPVSASVGLELPPVAGALDPVQKKFMDEIEAMEKQHQAAMSKLREDMAAAQPVSGSA